MDCIIRTAHKDYVCKCCGRIIHKDEQYIDRVILNYKGYVGHIRYHDECPTEHTTLDKVFHSLKKLTAVPCIYKNEKYLIQGIIDNDSHLNYWIKHWTTNDFSFVDVFDKELTVVLD